MSDGRHPSNADSVNPFVSELSDDLNEEPQFGLVDVIEAFTAMRQELRTQSRETRDFSQSLQGTNRSITELTERLLNAATKIQDVASASTNDDTSRRLAETIAEIDHHILRAVHAVRSTSNTASNGADTDSLQAQIADDLQSLGVVGRWFSKPLMGKLQASIRQWAESQDKSHNDDATAQGLEMLSDRVERLMIDQNIERINTVGLTFDGQIMNAVEAVQTGSHPGGTVIEQLAPAYRWRGQLIKYAQVRITR